MARLLPKDFIDTYGELEPRDISSDWTLRLPGDAAKEIAAELRAMGHILERTDLDIA